MPGRAQNIGFTSCKSVLKIRSHLKDRGHKAPLAFSTAWNSEASMNEGISECSPQPENKACTPPSVTVSSHPSSLTGVYKGRTKVQIVLWYMGNLRSRPGEDIGFRPLYQPRWFFSSFWALALPGKPASCSLEVAPCSIPGLRQRRTDPRRL